MPVTMLTPRDPRHPRRTGEEANEQMAYLDLVGQARWKDGDTLKKGEIAVSRRYLADRWNWSKSRVGRFLKRMEEEGEIERLGTVEPPGHLAGHFAGQQAGHLKVVNYGRFEVPRDTLRDTCRDGQRDKVVPSSNNTRDEYHDEVRRVFDLCRELRADRMGKTSGPPLQLTDKRQSKIRARLREGFTEEQLKATAHGFYADDWEGRDQYLDPVYAFKDDDTVRRHLERGQGLANGGPDTGSRADALAGIYGESADG